MSDSSEEDADMDILDPNDDQDDEFNIGKRRKLTREQQIYGVFADDSDQEDKPKFRATKNVSFVKSKAQPSLEDVQQMDMDEMEQEEEERPSFGSSASHQGLGFSQKEQEQERPGLGGGLGWKSKQDATLKQFETMQFSSTKNKRPKNQPIPVEPSVKTPQDFATFSKHTKGFGLKMMMKMGYKPGEGLGQDGAGIVNPIDVKLRPSKMGLGHRGFDERTEAVKTEQRRKREEGSLETLSDDEQVTKVPEAAWRRGKGAGKKGKRASRFKTAAQLVAEQETSVAMETQHKIVDMTGKEARVLSSVSDIPAVNQLSMIQRGRLPELRHNLMMLLDMNQTELMNVARSMAQEKSKLTMNTQLQVKIESRIEQSASHFEHLSKLLKTATQLAHTAKSLFVEPVQDVMARDATFIEWVSQLDSCLELFDSSLYSFYKQYKMDQVVVGALAPLFKVLVRDWNPLQDPRFAVSTFTKWRHLLVIEKEKEKENTMDWKPDHVKETSVTTSPYESMLYHHWLPRIRSAINNDWNVYTPEAVITLIECWHPQKEYFLDPAHTREPSAFASDACLIPFWLYCNILDQLIFPKLKSAIDACHPLKDTILPHTWLLPWLAVLDPSRLEKNVFEPLRYQLGMALGTWKPQDPRALQLIFTPKVVETFLAKSILPKLITCLRQDLRISPDDPFIEPLVSWVFPWKDVIPEHLFGHLLEAEFFPLWHNVLYIWLKSGDKSHFKDISDWFTLWKSVFSEANLSELAEVKEGFKKGLSMMQAGLQGTLRAPSPPAAPGASVARYKSKEPVARVHKPVRLTFKELVEQVALDHGCVVMALNRSHPTTGKALFRITAHDRKTGGVVVYLDEDVIYCQQTVQDAVKWLPIGLDEIMTMAVK